MSFGPHSVLKRARGMLRRFENFSLYDLWHHIVFNLNLNYSHQIIRKVVAHKGHIDFFPRSQLINLRSQLINLRSQLTNLRSQLINLRSQHTNLRSKLTNLQSFKVTKMAGRFVFVCFIVMTLPSQLLHSSKLSTNFEAWQPRKKLFDRGVFFIFNYCEMLSFLVSRGTLESTSARKDPQVSRTSSKKDSVWN